MKENSPNQYSIFKDISIASFYLTPRSNSYWLVLYWWLYCVARWMDSAIVNPFSNWLDSIMTGPSTAGCWYQPKEIFYTNCSIFFRKFLIPSYFRVNKGYHPPVIKIPPFLKTPIPSTLLSMHWDINPLKKHTPHFFHSLSPFF